jgi:transposase-like protein
MALCLNPQCQKRVASKSSNCPYCGSAEISEFNTYTKSESLVDEISIENFEKVVKNSKPFVERTIINEGTKGSFKSKLAVRLQFLARKAFRRR